MTYSLLADGTLTTPNGFRATGVHAGLKPTRDRDLGLLMLRNAATVAAHLGAASGAVGAWSTAMLRRSSSDIRAIAVLSGVNGGRGAAATEACNHLAAVLAEEAWIKPEQVVLLARSDADVPLDVEQLKPGLLRALDELDSGGGRRLALALALDATEPRMAAVEITLSPEHTVSIGGAAVGDAAGRYLLTTDAAIPAKLLSQAVDTVLQHHPDLDQSSLLIVASGAVEHTAIRTSKSKQFAVWQDGLLALMAVLLST